MSPGTVVQTSSAILRNQDTARQFVCLCAGHPDSVLRLPAGLLLPVSQFLERQPMSEFWAVIHKDRMAAGKACFLEVPRSIKIGPVPHRFESEGECVYYLMSYALSDKLFLVAHVGRHNLSRQAQ